MDKALIQRQAYARMSELEDRYSENVPISVNAYWRLNYLIAEGLRAYIGSYGLLPIHVGDANDGRHDLGLGPLSQFERDAIRYLAEHIKSAEEHFNRRNQMGNAFGNQNSNL